jgi:hypothetical protein
MNLNETTQVTKNLTSISRERFWLKLWRTIIGLGIGALLYFADLDSGVEKWGWVLVGVLVAGEWVLYPFRLLAAFVKDSLAPAIAALRKALGKNGSGG